MLPRPLWLLIALLALALPPARGSLQVQQPPAPPKPHREVQVLLKQGEQARLAYRYPQALRLYNEALEKARALKDRAGEAEALHEIGYVLYSTGEHRKALAHYDHALLLRRSARNRRGEALTLNNIAAVYLSLAELPKALQRYEQALPLCRAGGDKETEAATLTGIGMVCQIRGEMPKALQHYEQALTLFRSLKDKRNEATTLNNIGAVYKSTGEPRKALQYYEQALTLSREAGDGGGEATTLSNIGAVYDVIDQPRKALEYYQQALPLSRAAGDRAGEATTLNKIGAAYDLIGEPEQALEQFNQALPLFQALEDRRGVGNTLGNIGAAYDSSGDPRKALDHYNQALPLLRAADDRAGEATALHNIGMVYSGTGEPREAMEFLEKARRLRRAVGDKASEAITLTAIGALYHSTGEPRKALAYLEQALPLRRAVGDKGGEAATLDNIGVLYRTTDEPRKALEYLERALPLRRAAGDIRGEATTLTSLSAVYQSTGELRKAMGYLERALPLRRGAGDKVGEAVTLNNLGTVLRSAGELEKALPYFGQALQLFRSVDDIEGEATVLTNEAGARFLAGDRPAATRLVEQAVTLLEKVRGALSTSPDAEIGFLGDRGDVYRWRADLCFQDERHEEAFHAVQQAKAGAVIDLTARGKVDFSRALSPQDRRQEHRLAAEVNRRHRPLLHAMLQGPGATPEQSAALQKADTALAAFHSQLYARYPEVARRRGAAGIELPETARFLRKDTALLEYVSVTMRVDRRTIADRTLLFCVTMQGGAPRLQVYPVERTQSQLTELAAKLQAEILARGDRFRLTARELHRLLIAPAAAQLAGKERVIICPDGPLWNIPFQVLLRETPTAERFLINDFEVVYAYSATHAHAALEASDRPDRRKPAAELLALADPDFGELAGPKVSEAARSLALRGGGLSPLPGTRAEAAALRRLFTRATVRTGGKAQEAHLKSEAGRYRYLHLATHAIVHPEFPLLSNVALAQKPLERGENGFLTAREIFDLNLAAEMVVLSACDTGRGALPGGEGIYGLLWALFAAGSPTQVVSQWRVEDRSTAKLMEGFYRRLKASNGKGKGAALQSAALELMRDGRHHHPFYWAPFILVGDWR